MTIFEHNTIKVLCYTLDEFNIAVVFEEDNELSKSKIRDFVNEREKYKYQSVILDALYNSLKIRENFLITKYKDKNKTTRITKNKRTELVECDKEIYFDKLCL